MLEPEATECAVQIGGFGRKWAKIAQNGQLAGSGASPNLINPHELKYQYACLYKYFYAVYTFSAYMMILQSRFFRKLLFILFRVNDEGQILRKYVKAHENTRTSWQDFI
jgi:hypothetical protein